MYQLMEKKSGFSFSVLPLKIPCGHPEITYVAANHCCQSLTAFIYEAPRLQITFRNNLFFFFFETGLFTLAGNWISPVFIPRQP